MEGSNYCDPSDPVHDISSSVMGEQEVGTVQEKAVLSQVLLEQVGANIFIGWSTQEEGHAVQHV